MNSKRSATEVYCVECGEKTSYRENFCSSCGTSVVTECKNVKPTSKKRTIKKRLLAATLDEALWVGLIPVLGLPTAGIGSILPVIYAVCQDAFFGGGTSAGRKLLDQVLVNEHGVEVSHLKGIMRNGLRLAMWSLTCGIMFFVDCALVIFHPEGKTVVDMMLNTTVIDRIKLDGKEK